MSETNDQGEPAQRQWTCSLTNYSCSGPVDVPRKRGDEAASPDGDWLAFVRDENLWVRNAESGEERQLSEDGEEHYGYGVIGEGCCYTVTDRLREAQQRPIVFWSPDSRRIATYRLDERKVEDIHLLQTVGYRPVLHSYKYALPGDEHVPLYTLHIFDVESGARVDIKSDPIQLSWGQGIVAQVDVRWSKDGNSIFFPDMSRDTRQHTLHRADSRSGESRAVITEQSETFIDAPYRTDQHAGVEKQSWTLANNDQDIIWWSQRDGWGHFYRYDANTGTLKNQITRGDWAGYEIYQVDDAGQYLYFSAFGRDWEDYPYQRQLYRVKYDGSGLQRLTEEYAHHELYPSADGRYFVNIYSTRSQAPVTVLRQNNGKVIRTLEKADISDLETVGFRPGTLFSVKSRDRTTDLYGFIYRPANFDPQKKYPIIDYIYPGPQIGAVRTRGFTASPAGNAQALTELGFVVIQFDATGTPFRSKAFHDTWYRNMADNGLIDHVHVIKQLAARHPEIDIDKVGIFGHSGGGFSSTGAILRFPDFFKVAVSGAGNHDNRSYSFNWGEKYQGLLEKDALGGDNYDSQANHLLAKNLKGKLLLHYGSMDDNVHSHSTLLLVQELIKHNKDFDLMVLPNGNHRYASLYSPHAGDHSRYMTRLTWDYFVRHLRGEEPPKEYKIEAR